MLPRLAASRKGRHDRAGTRVLSTIDALRLYRATAGRSAVDAGLPGARSAICGGVARRASEMDAGTLAVRTKRATTAACVKEHFRRQPAARGGLWINSKCLSIA